MKLSKLLRISTLTLSTLSVAPSMQGMQRLRSVFAQAATAIKKQAANIKPQTKLALTAGTIAATSTILYNNQKHLSLNTIVFAQQAHIAPAPKQSEQISPEERERVNKLIDEHYDEVQKIWVLHQFKWLPGYIVKRNTSRVEGAKILAGCIKEYDLKYVTVPDKWEHRGFVVAKKLEGTHYTTMNLAQAQDVATLLKCAKCNGGHYHDLHNGVNGNLLFCYDGRVGFIDTEAHGFFCPTYKCSLEYLLRWNTYISPEATKFVQNEIRKADEQSGPQA